MENDLDKEQHARVENHLHDCPSCMLLKSKMGELVSRLSDLEEEIPFFLKNRLYNIPEHIEKNRSSKIFFPKWAAAVLGSVILFFNLFYFTNLCPPANKEIHSLVANVERMIVRTGGWIEKIKKLGIKVDEAEFDKSLQAIARDCTCGITYGFGGPKNLGGKE